MKFVRSLMAVSFALTASMFVACGDDSGSSANEDSSSSTKLDCTAKNSVVVVSPAAGDVFSIGDTITVIYGSDIQAGGFDIEYRVNEDSKGKSLVGASVGPEEPDGKTCYEEKVVLDAEVVTASDEAVIRVIPYSNQGKGANSAAFTVKE